MRIVYKTLADRIETAIEKKGLTDTKIVRLVDMEAIAIEAKCSVRDVMGYLRFERR